MKMEGSDMQTETEQVLTETPRADEGTIAPGTPDEASQEVAPKGDRVPPILTAQGLYHVYESNAEEGNVVALRGLSVAIKAGEAVAVVGPSGAGKSTLLKALGGLLKPSAGKVFLRGKDITQLTGPELVEARRSAVSFIFQEGNLLPNLSALDNVMQPLRHQGIPAWVAKREAVALLERLEVAHRMNALPSRLSGGEQQRVAIARALITRPLIILADEPTGAVDPHTTQIVMELFKRLHREENTAFLIVTHSEEVSLFADRSLELLDGRFVAQHGGDDVDLDQLAESRELIIDSTGTVNFPPDVMTNIGGEGHWTITEASPDRIILERTTNGSGRTLVPVCPACETEYVSEDVRSCPSCGGIRPLM